MSTQFGRTGVSTHMSVAGERVEWVDTAKGLCIILVVMMHSTLGMGEAVGREGWLHHVVAFAKPFRIPAFFLVSGLFVARALSRDWPTYLDRRVVHFAYFYILWLTIQSVFKFGQLYDDSFLRFITNYALAFVEPFGTLWFIYVLAVFSVMAKLLMRVPHHIHIIGAATLQIIPMLFNNWGWQIKWDLLDYVCTNYVYFVAGYVFASGAFTYAHEAARRIHVTLTGLLVWAMISGLFAFAQTGHPIFKTWASLPFISLGLGLLGAFALIAVAVLLVRLRLSAPFQYCGHHSIAIYLAFFVPLVVTRLIFIKLGLVQDVGFASLVITIVAITTPLIFERIVRHTWMDFLFVRPKSVSLLPPKQKDPAEPTQIA